MCYTLNLFRKSIDCIENTHHSVAVDDRLLAGHASVRTDRVLRSQTAAGAVLVAGSALSAAVVLAGRANPSAGRSITHVLAQFTVLRTRPVAYRLALLVAQRALTIVRLVQARNHVAAG